MDVRGTGVAKLMNSDFIDPAQRNNEALKLTAIGNYGEQTNLNGNQEGVDCSAENLSFVTVIPVEYPARQKAPNQVYNNQHPVNQEEIGSYQVSVNDKDQSEMSSGTSASTQLNGTNRGAAVEKPYSVRVPNGQLCVFLSNGTCACVDVENGVHTTAAAVLKTLVENEDLRLPLSAMDVFALWMVSSELEVQLKPHHKPFKVYAEWPQLVKRFTKLECCIDPSDPKLCLRRNAFYHKNDEMRLRDPAVVELLYCEAKHNVLVGRYPFDLPETFLLGSLVARITHGNFVLQQHTPTFFRNRLPDYLPSYACVKSTPWSLIWPLSKLQRPDKTAPESLIVEQLKKLPNNIPSQRLMLNYLKRCWSRPFYGAAFFRGQIEERHTSRMSSWFNQGDLEILVAVSCVGVYLIEPREGTVLLGLKFGEFVWDFALPYYLDEPECFPCIFLQFASPPSSPRDGNDTCVVQIFSKQAAMVNALITFYTNRRRSSSSAVSASGDEVDGVHGEQDMDDVMAPLTNPPQSELLDSSLTNKLHRLSLATFDDEGNFTLR